ncbi:hypothetical protein ACFQZO_27575 [Bradyrhizobium sp. GCM10027634]|uniref:hypothetical protein n=1 Tax=unclassified Bradyrhizobium TaxID=2631580 RepID=UPI00263BE6E5|nr:hypothetical protein [Bradyrhizobium sp. WYCCWR 12677]MDN5004613.1 hypothetical protein [Bradyrhizobium sp. WYCCWR 12677]
MNPALDLLYRLIAIGISIYWARKAWYGYIERKILFVNDDWLDWSRWSRQMFYRDTMPIRYWMQMVGTAFGSLLCLVGAIIGWQPNG